MDPAELRRLQPGLAALALELADELGVALDGSRASIVGVVRMLDELHAEYARRPDPEGADRRAFELAAYLIGVLERDGERGEWLADHPERGRGTFPFRWRGRDLFLVDWCWTRIVGDSELDVRGLFEQACAARVEERRGGAS